MKDLEYKLDDPDPENNLVNEGTSKTSKKIIAILVSTTILFLAGFLIFLILYLHKKDEDKPSDNSSDEPEKIIEDRVFIYYNLSYPENTVIKNTFKEGEINYNPTIGKINNGLDYDKTERNLYDLYIPTNLLERKNKYNKIILCIHGGAWMGGDKILYEKDCKEKTKLGYICASMSYNFLKIEYAPNFTIYRILDEITAVQETIKKILKLMGFDENKLEICLAGGSAGAHLSLLYSYWLGKNSPIPIKFVFNMVAPVTLEFDYWWRYKEDVGPLNSIEPKDIEYAKEHNLILNNSYMYYNNTNLALTMIFFLGKGFHILREMFISYENWDINQTNEKYIQLFNEVKILFPVNHIDKNTLPTLCYYGGRDIDVGVDQYAYLRTLFNKYDNKDNLALIYSKYAIHNESDTVTDEGKKAKKDLDAKFLEFTNKYFSKD